MVITIDLPEEYITLLQAKSGCKIEDAVVQLIKRDLQTPIGTKTESNQNELVSKGLNSVDPRAQKILQEMRAKSSKTSTPNKREIIHLAGSGGF